MKVRELLMLEMSPYIGVKRRSFEFNASNLAIDEFARTTNGGRNVHAGAINALGAGVLKQATVPQHTSVIENGWQTRRYNFILEIEHDVPMGNNTKIVQYLSGYTDSTFNIPVFTTDRISLPPDLQFRFTNNITVSETVSYDAMGNRRISAYPQDAYNILYGAYQPQSNDVEYSTRVQDTIAYASTHRWIGSGVDSNHDMNSGMQDLMRQFGPGDATRIGDTTRGGGDLYGLDGSVAFSSDKVKHSHASSALPTDFLGRAFNCVAVARDCSAKGSNVSADLDNLLGFASQHVREKSIVRDTTLGMFQRNLSLDFDGTVDWQTLQSMFGSGLDDVTRCIPFAEVQRTKTQSGELGWNPMDSQHWDGLDYETVCASAFATQLPAVMMDRLVEVVRFTADNHGRPGTHIRPGMWAIDIRDCHSYINGFDRNTAATQFSAMLETTVLPSVSQEIGLPISISCGADLFMETQFQISIDGRPSVPFTMPNFSPCAMSPLMHRDINQVHKLSVDLVNLVGAVTDVNNF